MDGYMSEEKKKEAVGPERLELESMDIVNEQRNKLKELFPEAFLEGEKIDFDRLRLSLGALVDEGKERFGLTWSGKAECFRTIQKTSTGTLNPLREQSVNFDQTQNVIIEGDNLEALKLLQKSYLGKVKMIYIDPPYNTGSDFIYPDDYSESLETYFKYTGQVDNEGRKFSSNAEADGRFHSKWLSMMYPRLFLARNLLRDDGLIFISIDDHEVANLRGICDEIFGEENFLGCACRVSKKANNQGDYWAPNFDYLLTYAKNREVCAPFFGGVNYDSYDQVDEEGPRKGEKYQLLRLYMTSLDPMRGCTNQRYYIEAPDGTLLIPPGNSFPSEKVDGGMTPPRTADDKVWRWTQNRYLQEKDKIVVKKVRSSNLVDSNGNEVFWNVFTKTYLNDVVNNATAKPNSLIEDHINQNSSHELNALDIKFSFAKPSSLISYLCEIAKVGKEDLVMDFFAGSGSTAHAVLELNKKDGGSRRFILIQLPEQIEESEYKHIAEITQERVRRVIKKLDSEESEGQASLFKVDRSAEPRGFRVFRLDSSNFNPWKGSDEKDGRAIYKQIELAVQNVRKDRDPDSILLEILLKSGFELSAKISKLSLAEKVVYSIEDGALLICLDLHLTKEVIAEMAQQKPIRIVCLDAGFAGNDQLKVNAVETFKAKGITFKTV